MQILDRQTQHQISDLVEACASYWELRGVAPEHSNEMQLELEQHLQQAVSDGKSLEAVLGHNPPAFAEAWAREMRPRFWRGGAIALHWLVYVLSIVSTTALISQLLARAPSFTFTIFAAYLLIGSGLLALLLQLGGFLSPRIRTRQGREALLLAGAVLAVLVLRLAGMKVNWGVALLSWSWPVTVLLLALAVGLFSLDVWRTSHSEPPSSAAASGPALRHVTMFIGSVAVFDVMMFVTSVTVFDFCRLAVRPI
jgi:hypothetical protein